MDIKRAKEEIKKSINAYLTKTPQGEYQIPSVRQRPIFLMGPAGIGKTAIVEQVARECNVALVSYTITHHTRESAVGIPFVDKKYYKKEPYSVTQYTISEIIGSVYDKINRTDAEEGILFVDEINCISDSLAPTILQFLQCKTFGNHKIPDGWIVVAAGNPPEYNKSVHEFDVVTLDRVKKIDVEVNYDVWKEYAYNNRVHGAILSYLELNRDDFYIVEADTFDKKFVTARGWEDLSVMLRMYEDKGYEVDYEFITQYLQYPPIAERFAKYYELYSSVSVDTNADNPDYVHEQIYHIIDDLTGRFCEADLEQKYVQNIDKMFIKVREIYETSNENIRTDTNKVTVDAERELDKKLAAGLISGNDLAALRGAIRYITDSALRFGIGANFSFFSTDAFEGMQEDFDIIKNKMHLAVEDADSTMKNYFSYFVRTFGKGKDYDFLVGELSLNQYVRDNLCKVTDYE